MWSVATILTSENVKIFISAGSSIDGLDLYPIVNPLMWFFIGNFNLGQERLWEVVRLWIKFKEWTAGIACGLWDKDEGVQMIPGFGLSDCPSANMSIQWVEEIWGRGRRPGLWNHNLKCVYLWFICTANIWAAGSRQQLHSDVNGGHKDWGFLNTACQILFFFSSSGRSLFMFYFTFPRNFQHTSLLPSPLASSINGRIVGVNCLGFLSLTPNQQANLVCSHA